MALIELVDVHKSFPARGEREAFKALDGASFSVDAGEIIGILGPSGCGKSTILNIVAGLDETYQGSVLLKGRTVKEQLAAGFRIAYVFQEARLMPWRTVRQNIEFALEAAQFPQIEWRQKVDRVLELVELFKFADFTFSRLSSRKPRRTCARPSTSSWKQPVPRCWAYPNSRIRSSLSTTSKC